MIAQVCGPTTPSMVTWNRCCRSLTPDSVSTPSPPYRGVAPCASNIAEEIGWMQIVANLIRLTMDLLGWGSHEENHGPFLPT
jgi:hypothetical protein